MRLRWVVLLWILAVAFGCFVSLWLGLTVVIHYALAPVEAIAHVMGI